MTCRLFHARCVIQQHAHDVFPREFTSPRIIASAYLGVAKGDLLADTRPDLKPSLASPVLPVPMNRPPSKLKAALWMAGFLSLMLLMAISGREAARELNIFQIMELRS